LVNRNFNLLTLFDHRHFFSRGHLNRQHLLAEYSLNLLFWATLQNMVIPTFENKQVGAPTVPSAVI
jgi:hypothetical protein